LPDLCHPDLLKSICWLFGRYRPGCPPPGPGGAAAGPARAGHGCPSGLRGCRYPAGV